MKFTKAVAIVVLVIYIGVWALAIATLHVLIEFLAMPLILAALVALLVWFQKFMGITPRSPKFRDPEEPKDAE